jgi:hypothetical protein
MSRRAWLVAVLAPACGLFPDVSSLSSSDGGVDVTTKDAPIEDAMDASDGGAADTAADVDADAAPRSPCLDQHLFCDDFDKVPLGQLWDGKMVKSGPLALATSTWVTPPNALEAIASSAGSETMLSKGFPSAQRTHVELDAMLSSPGDPTNVELDFVNFDFAVPPAGYSYGNVNLQRWQGAAQLEQYASGGDAGSTGQDLTFPNTFATWKHVALDLDFGAQQVVLTIDGVVLKTLTFAPALTQCALTLSVGVTYTEGTTTDWNVFIDNVVVDQN